MSDRSHTWLLWTLAVIGLACDQGSKYFVFSWLNQNEPGEQKFAVVPDAFELLTQYTSVREPADSRGLASWLRTRSGDLHPRVNHGALFGVFGEYVGLANGLFATISVLAALAIIYWSTLKPTAQDAILCAALGLILAGTLGNLYDRVIFNGVRDFLHWHYAFEWPVFNVADCCLVCGAGLLLTQAFWVQPALDAHAVSDVSMSPMGGGVKVSS
jgi:lipoprotein signal peptidase